MNNTEKAYAEILEIKKNQGEIVRYKFEKLKFKLAEKTFFTPDFYVVYPGHIEIHEIKGGMIYDDAKAKFKIAADLFPEFVWKMWQLKNKTTGWQLILEM